MRGRKPAGPEYVEQLAGTPESKQRLQVILQTLAGELRVQEACALLGVGEVRFQQLRARALQGALHELQPRPLGRPRKYRSPEVQRIDELERRLLERDLELQTAGVQAEVATILGSDRRATDDGGKKTRRATVKLQRLRPR